jgi:type VI secretion system FHA domain protein
LTLTLTLVDVERLDNGQPARIVLDRHGAQIGRAPHVEWTLPDPKTYISSIHCEIVYRDGGYWLHDKSTNGTLLNGATQRMTGPHALQDGDEFAIGHYRVRAQLGGAGAVPAEARVGKGWPPGWDAPTPVMKMTPSGWTEAEAAPRGWDTPVAPSGGPGRPPDPVQSPSGWDAPAGGGGASPGWVTGPATPASLAPASGGGWGEAPPQTFSTPSPVAGGGWGDVPLSPPLPPFNPQPPPATGGWGAAPAAGPQSWAADPPPALGGAPSASAWGHSPRASPPPTSARAGDPWAPAPEPAPLAPAPQPDAVWGRFAEVNTVDWRQMEAPAPPPIAPHPPARAAEQPRPAAPSSPDDAWRALLAAAGVDAAAIQVPPAQAAAAAGSLLRRLVAGLIVMLEARARAKAELGAQGTSMEFDGNSPLKFSRSPDRALGQLLNPPAPGFMPAERAVEDAFHDLQAHQMATLAAMQNALRSTLDRFSPEAIRKRADTRGVLAKIIPAARDAALWEAYEREFEGVAKGSDEAFMDVFAKAFRTAYEQAAADMKRGRGRA